MKLTQVKRLGSALSLDINVESIMSLSEKQKKRAGTQGHASQ